jgi:hypothetical protein
MSTVFSVMLGLSGARQLTVHGLDSLESNCGAAANVASQKALGALAPAQRHCVDASPPHREAKLPELTAKPSTPCRRRRHELTAHSAVNALSVRQGRRLIGQQKLAKI